MAGVNTGPRPWYDFGSSLKPRFHVERKPREDARHACAALAVAGIGWIAAQETVRPPATAAITLDGAVVKVYSAERVVILKGADGRDVRLRVLPDARIMVNRKLVTLDDLAEGVPARVLYTNRDGAFQVSSIESPILAKPLP